MPVKAPLTRESILMFSGAQPKCQNGSSNDIRERIIKALSDQSISPSWFGNDELGQLWSNLRDQLVIFEHNSFGQSSSKRIWTIKGGRNNPYDFDVEDGTKTFHVEFKFSAGNKIPTIKNQPQICQLPALPKYFVNQQFERYFHQNALPQIATIMNIASIPALDTYEKQVFNTSPACMKDFKEKYKTYCKANASEADKAAYNQISEISKQCISKFIATTELNLSALSMNQTVKNQAGKHYMMYHNGTFYHETLSPDTFDFVSYKAEKDYYIIQTKSGHELKALLRWKNCNGIAFPAFQISLHK